MTRKIVILPYFGRLPIYFHLWLISCGNNPDIDWLVISDTTRPAQLPENVLWMESTMQDVEKRFIRKLGIKIWLGNPYKLCDFKAFYGYLFSDYVEGYDFWGYCDCDVIFGRISRFLPETLFEQYDKILRLGHLSFVRNSLEVNTNFLKYDTYKIILSSPIAYAHDEAVNGYHKGFAGELLEQGFRIYQSDELVADIDYKHFPFRVVTSPDTCCVFSYEDGKLEKISKQGDQIIQEEVAYVHLQKRNMQIADGLDPQRFYIYPNLFAPSQPELLEQDVFWQEVSSEAEGYFNFRKEKIKDLWRDIRRILYEPKKIECLRYRFRKK